MARSPQPENTGRVAQMRAAFTMTRQADPRLLPLMVFPALGVLAVLVVVGVVTGHIAYFAVLGVVGALATVTIVFGRRVTRAMYAQVEGQPGAAAAVAQALRGPWHVTPAVAVTRSQDLVHRVVGRPGVVLVGEGSPNRVGQLLAQEKKRVGRVLLDTPVYDVQVGDQEGQVPLRQLQRHLMKLPRNIKAKEVDGVEARMRALGGPTMPVPKGPMPRGGRVPRGKIR